MRWVDSVEWYLSGQRTFSERVRQAGFVIPADEIDVVPGKKPTARANSTVQVRRVLKGPAVVNVDQLVNVHGYRIGQLGKSVLVLGTKDVLTGFIWTETLAVSKLRLRYFEKLAEYEADHTKRLGYFLPHLESADLLDDADAFVEILRADYRELIELTPEFPRMTLRQRIRNPKTDACRIGRYGLMLGMCGHDADAKLLDEMVFDRPVNLELRGGLTGLLQGYLLIRGERALDQIDTRIIQDRSVNPQLAFGAINRIRNSARERIPAHRLRHSLHLLLDLPELVEFAIIVLQEMDDWEIQDKLVEMYVRDEEEGSRLKFQIVRFLCVCSNHNQNIDPPTVESMALAERAEKNLTYLSEIDPRTVGMVERSFAPKRQRNGCCNRMSGNC